MMRFMITWMGLHGKRHQVREAQKLIDLRTAGIGF